jgi:RNA polymerase sigma-70 factor, ECF subfamily
MKMLTERELTEIYDHHSHDIFVFVYGYLQSREGAEDITHDAFIRLIEFSEKKIITHENARPLLFTIARNLCIDFLRKNRRNSGNELATEKISSGKSLEEEIEAADLNERILVILNGLDPVTKSVFLLRKESLMHYKEIAEILSISQRTAKRKMRNALNHLQKKLEEEGYFDGFS